MVRQGLKKCGLAGVFMENEDEVVVAWTLAM